MIHTHDPNIMDTLMHNVKIKNMNSMIDTREIVVIYRVYYMFIKSMIDLMAINSSIKVVPSLMEANQKDNTTFVPRLLNSNKILSDEDSKFESLTKPLPIKPARSSIERVIQFSEGS